MLTPEAGARTRSARTPKITPKAVHSSAWMPKDARRNFQSTLAGKSEGVSLTAGRNSMSTAAPMMNAPIAARVASQLVGMASQLTVVLVVAPAPSVGWSSSRPASLALL
jgi:hypothetical protein